MTGGVGKRKFIGGTSSLKAGTCYNNSPKELRQGWGCIPIRGTEKMSIRLIDNTLGYSKPAETSQSIPQIVQEKSKHEHMKWLDTHFLILVDGLFFIPVNNAF